MSIENQSPRNHQELLEAMHQVKLRITKREDRLAELWQQLPSETAKAAVGAVVPGLLRSRVALGAFTILKSAWTAIFSSKTNGEGVDWKNIVFKGAKELGLFTLIGTVIQMVMRKKEKI